jgi:arylsulfatase A-like enzyme/predicted negative regulator of RcsB-dependent stress response
MGQRKNTSATKSPWLCGILPGIVLVLIVGLVWLLWRHGISPKDVPNVILISIDTCRADYLSCYGYPRQTTPNIDQLATQSVIFRNVISPIPLTLPAHCSMLAGTIPPYHGVHDNLDYRLGDSNVTLAEILKKHGFATGAIISAFVLDSQFGINQGFDMFNDRFEKPRMAGAFSERKAQETSRFAIKWLDQHKNDKFFLFLHYFDPHNDYVPPEPFASRFADNLYAGEIAYADYCIGLVILKLKELGLFDSSLVIITADHGEMLGEHGELTHGYFIYQSAVKVPLLVKLPGQNKPKEVEEMVGLIDIVPTVCSLLNIQPPLQIQGKDLSAYLLRKSISREKRHVYIESLTPTKYNANTLLGVVTDQLKYIQTTRPELYDLANDPHESQNLINQTPQQTKTLQSRLREILQQSVPTGRPDGKMVLDEQARKRLESLGYVSGKVAEELEFDQSKDDPKDLIDLHLSVEKAQRLISQKKLTEAKRLCQKMLLRHDDYYGVYRHLARIYFEEGDKQKAQAYMRQSLKLNPDQAGLHFNFAMILAEQGRYDDAIDHLKEVLRVNPNQILAHNKIGNVLYKIGRFDEAVRHWRVSLRLKPDQPEIKRIIAAALAQKRKQLPPRLGD